jgi:hypothetical protein
MGMAKHYEDDMKIREERYVLLQEDEHKPIYRRHTIVKTTYIETKEVFIEQTKPKKHKRKNKKLLCCECNAAFLFTGGEQKFYEDHNLNEPKRCLKCRKENKIINKTKGV